MKILQAGVAKSGNYWLYKIVAEMYKMRFGTISSYVKTHPDYVKLKSYELSYDNQVDIDTITFDVDRISLCVSNILKEEIVDIESYFSEASIVWTHSELGRGFDKISSYLDKVVYIIRDPRDVFNSKINFAFSEYSQKHLKERSDIGKFRKNRIRASVVNWNSHVFKALKKKQVYPGKIHIVFYERLLADPFSEIERLAQFFGFSFSETELGKIVDLTSAKTLRLKDKNHVSNSIDSYKWKKLLDKREKRIFLKECRFLLNYLGYPTDDNGSDLPKEPVVVDKQLHIRSQIFLIRSIFSLRLFTTLLFSDRSISEIITKTLNILRR